MKFYKQMYASDRFKKKKKMICHKLKWNIGQLNVYVIALAEGTDLLEIYHCALLKQRKFRRDVFVVGIANGYMEALELTQEMIQDIYDKTKDTKIKEYILKQQSR